MSDPQIKPNEAYHLFRCLIHTAMADTVIHEAEVRVLEQVVPALGRIEAETWEEAWDVLDNGLSSTEVFGDVPDDPRLRRFILREMVAMAMADGQMPAAERDLIEQAARIFGLSDEFDRFLDWARRSYAVQVEGRTLLLACAPTDDTEAP